MAASDFNYADFLLYTGATNVNHSLYSTVVHGVLGVLNNQYAIYREVGTLDIDMYLEAGQTVLEVPAMPINGITAILHDTNPVDYTWYGRDVVLTIAPTETRIPINLTLEVGYAEHTPSDIKLAVYRHIDAIIYSVEKHTDNLEKVINSTVNTTYYKADIIPLSVLSVYEFYSARLQVL